MARTAAVIVSVHGCQGEQRFSYVGGRDLQRGQVVIRALNASGFAAGPYLEARLAGLELSNICNQGRYQRGVQLEITRAERERLVNDDTSLLRYADAVRSASAPI